MESGRWKAGCQQQQRAASLIIDCARCINRRFKSPKTLPSLWQESRLRSVPSSSSFTATINCHISCALTPSLPSLASLATESHSRSDRSNSSSACLYSLIFIPTLQYSAFQLSNSHFLLHAAVDLWPLGLLHLNVGKSVLSAAIRA